MPDLFLGGKWCSAVLNESQSLEAYRGCDRTHGSVGPVQVPGFMLHPFTGSVQRIRRPGCFCRCLLVASLLPCSEARELHGDKRADASADSAEDESHPTWGP